MRRLVVGVSGASGVVYAQRLLEVLRERMETHLVLTSSARLTLKMELPGVTVDAFHRLAHRHYKEADVGAPIASGSFATEAMVVVPCSMRTLAAISMGLGDNLLTRAADVTLKERRRLILVVREAPFNLAHLRNMVTVTEMGGIILPPLPAFYQKPQTVQDVVDHTVAKILDLLGLSHDLVPPWAGPSM